MQNLNKVAVYLESKSPLFSTKTAAAVSLVDVVSERVARSSIVIIGRVIDILSVGLGVGVAGHRVVGVCREEQAVPCAVLLVLLVFVVCRKIQSNTVENVKLFFYPQIDARYKTFCTNSHVFIS